MQRTIESRYDQFVRDLETVVNIDSGSGDADGLMAVLTFFRDRFDKLGWHTATHRFNGGAAPCLEVSNRPPFDAAEPYDFLFLGHMDTVFPKGTAAQRPFSIQGRLARGPGVGDMKGGLVQVLHVAETLQRRDLADDVSICIGFNSDEEIGSRSSRQWFESLAVNSRRVLVFEPCRATGHRVIQRKGVGGFTVICHGKAAHAGAEPEKGANAVVELANQVLAVMDFGAPEAGTSVNVTTISGGTAENVIPDFARAGVDVRFSSVEEARRIEQCFDKLGAKTSLEGVRVEVQGEINRLPMVPSEATLRLWDRIAAIGTGLGLEMKLVNTGGASDGNFTAARGIPTVDAMGPRAGSVHSEDEYLELDSIVPNVRLVCEIVRAAAQGALP